jgi:RHS repeat-associated protein
LHKVTDPRNHTTIYDWDTTDRLSKVTDPLTRITSYPYDLGSNPATLTTPRGKVTAYDYDDLDRVRSVRYGATGTTQESQTTYTYDAGNRTRTVDDSAGGTSTLTPDNLDRLRTVVDPQGQVDYTYDAADRRATMTVAGQPQTTYGYNNANQLTSVARGSDTATIGYDGVGRRGSLTLPAGISQTYGYDDASRLTSLTYKRGTATLGAITYTPDPLGRTTRVDGSYARVALPAVSGPFTYDAADQRNGLTYDDDGNLAAEGSATYSWNARGQLTTLTKPGLTVSYGYDGAGRRASRTAGGATTGYLYDGLNTVQQRAGSTVSANLLTGGVDEVFARDSRSLLTDALGSTVASADTSSVAAEYTYDPYGGTTVTGDDQGNPTRFTGREDEGDGLYHYRNRFYSTSQQRFLSRDPIGLASGDTNPYAYVFNQPTGLVDPMGTKPQGSCAMNSFTAGTQVLMEDRSTKPIEQIRPGDRVMAGNPESDTSTPQEVAATIVGEGEKDLVEISTEGADALTGTVTATDGHPFWVDDDGDKETPGGRWIDASELRQGQWLKTSDGRLVQVSGTHAYKKNTDVYNLTVDNVHTYYVLAGTEPVLVHNCNKPNCTCGPSATELRNTPGAAGGNGANMGGTWLRGSAGNAGAFPGQIADRLRGRQFDSFNDFRTAFWTEVGNDSSLSSGFSVANVTRMQGGNSPFVATSQQYGGGRNYVLHHVQPIQHGGGVYDMDNLVVVTPLYHSQILTPSYHYGNG